jgi:hypothetical protein
MKAANAVHPMETMVTEARVDKEAWVVMKAAKMSMKADKKAWMPMHRRPPVSQREVITQ